ncbi:MAG: acyl-CoA synthetase FdrA, partial [Anaerolineales bacterium]|nr:acyl-CoA synthetase FdrA [Anaerolineales bacterium]
GVMMGTIANKDMLARSNLLVPDAETAMPEDLVIAVSAESYVVGQEALSRVDELLKRPRTSAADQEFRPRSLETAVRVRPESQWVLVSLPGRYAVGVAQQALELGKHIFLYSDNVSLEDEMTLKQSAAEKGLLLMGPDCGTAVINGIGLGFANRIRRGAIGIVAASGSGLQAIMVAIDKIGEGVSHAIGTGGRDLKEEVGAITARQGMDLLDSDPGTQVIVLSSKPPSTAVAEKLIKLAQTMHKPVVVNFLGYSPPARRIGNVYFALTLHEAAEVAKEATREQPEVPLKFEFAPSQRYMRGLFSGGTLAYETMLLLRGFGERVYSNIPLDREDRLSDSAISREHTIVDLGEDEFTIGRLHPMIDNDLRLRRFYQESADPETAVILLDVVLGDGAHPNPAADFAPAIASARSAAHLSGRQLEVVALVVGSESDPQEVAAQIELLREAGAWVETRTERAVDFVGRIITTLNCQSNGDIPAVALDGLTKPLDAINIGLESFYESLTIQGAGAVHVEWRPPAQGNEELMSILANMQS